MKTIVQLTAFVGIQAVPPLVLGATHKLARLVQQRRLAERLGRQGLLRQGLVVVIGTQDAEGIGGGFRRAKRRRAYTVQDVPQGPHAGLAQEAGNDGLARFRSEEHTSELQSLMRISDAGFCLKKKIKNGSAHIRTHSTNITPTRHLTNE